MPSFPATWRYLSPRQREVAIARMSGESNNEGHTGLSKKALKRAFTDWKVYIFSIMYASMNVNLSSIGGFLPTIVKGLGYTNAQVCQAISALCRSSLMFCRRNCSLCPRMPWLWQ